MVLTETDECELSLHRGNVAGRRGDAQDRHDVLRDTHTDSSDQKNPPSSHLVDGHKAWEGTGGVDNVADDREEESIW